MDFPPHDEKPIVICFSHTRIPSKSFMLIRDVLDNRVEQLLYLDLPSCCFKCVVYIIHGINKVLFIRCPGFGNRFYRYTTHVVKYKKTYLSGSIIVKKALLQITYFKHKTVNLYLLSSHVYICLEVT